MSDTIVCIECGATSYNVPGKTPIRCATCWEEMKDRAEKAEAENKKLLDGLSWYADDKNYFYNVPGKKAHSSVWIADMGERARMALKGGE